MLGHPEYDLYLINARRAALLREASESRLGSTARQNVEPNVARTPLPRPSEPRFNCVGPECLPVHQ